jgi:flagellar motor switch protein FliN/FliY
MADEKISTSFDWIKSLAPKLASHDRVPLLCGPSAFSWEELAERLKTQLQVKDLKIDTSIPLFETKEEVEAHTKDLHITLSVFLSDYVEPVYVMLSKRELVHLLCHLLGQPDAADTLEEPYLLGFVSFLAAAAFDTIETLVPQEGWSLRLGPEEPVSEGDFLSLAVGVHVDETLTIYPRLAVPVPFFDTFREKYEREGNLRGSRVSEKVEVVVAMQVGTAFLSFDEWASVGVGDFVLLDDLTVMPGESKGKILMTLDSKPIYRAKVKKGALKIVEPVTHEEVNSVMESDEEEIDEIEEETPQEEELDEEGPAEPDEEEVGEFTEGYEQQEEEAAEKESIEESLEIEEAGHPPIVPFDQESLDVQMCVEIGRMKITLDKLTKLQPGNILNLNVNPESGVDLVVNGKVVGRGELLKIGDLLGVRILDLGK